MFNYMRKNILRFIVITIFSLWLLLMKESVLPYYLRVAIVIAAFVIFVFQIKKQIDS